MSKSIKKFFSRKKEEAAFKLKIGGGMGQGRALNAPTPETSQKKPAKDAYQPPKRQAVSEEARAAANAALARVEKKSSKEFNTSLAAIKAQAKRELEAEKKLKEELDSSTRLSEKSDEPPVTENKNLACQGVFFRCPLISEDVLPKNEWKVKIKEFLYQQLEIEPGLTACLIIHNCNTKEKAQECCEILSKYIENLQKHPDEEKYCKIRMSNRIFEEKVRYIEGALEFLNAAGFREVEIDNESFLLWTKDNMEADIDLASLQEGLHNAEPIRLELDRNMRILLPSQAKRVELPPDFYRISPEEIKREQQLRTEAIENAQILKTKAMREREEQRNLRMYRYSLIRVKLPNGLYVQGTFNVYEKIADIFEFIRSCLADEALEFNLVASSEGKFGEDDMEKTLYNGKLIPNAVLLFVTADGESHTDTNFLKEDLLMLVESL